MTQRLFVAIPIPPEVRQAVDGWREGLHLPGRLVPPAKLHVTLRFIGEVDAVGRDRVLAALDTSPFPGPFSFRIGAIGAFPKPSKATVAWAALDDRDGAMAGLASVVDEAVASAGLGHEDRPFRPHLTLSRIRPPRNLREVLATSALGAKVMVDEIVLYRSRFVEGSVTYDPLERFSLAP